MLYPSHDQTQTSNQPPEESWPKQYPEMLKLSAEHIPRPVGKRRRRGEKDIELLIEYELYSHTVEAISWKPNLR